ncbi:MAG: cytochrome c-type biogenesis protein CcmH [Chloroflexi bacterium]|nr:cytochrome c-type biogenesis protein CcmH [Chloroflexota bacterium]
MKVTKALWLILALFILGATLAAPVLAQTPTPNEINAIAKDLWCPLCNGVRLDNCELQACIQMREMIAQKLMEGASKEQIKAYFVQQYGDVVLGAPERTGFSGVVWILPVLIGAVGLGWLIFFVRAGLRRRRLVTAQASVAPTKAAAQARNTYLKRVDEEMGRDG